MQGEDLEEQGTTCSDANRVSTWPPALCSPATGLREAPKVVQPRRRRSFHVDLSLRQPLPLPRRLRGETHTRPASVTEMDGARRHTTAMMQCLFKCLAVKSRRNLEGVDSVGGRGEALCPPRYGAWQAAGRRRSSVKVSWGRQRMRSRSLSSFLDAV